jgi:predicted dehydrogenase
MDRLRWGILSTAGINDVVIGPLQRSGRSELVAVASRSARRARAFAEERGIPRSYGSYEELLSDPAVDAVYVSVPNSLHRRWAVEAAGRGKHVLCEKPIVLAMEDFDAVQRAARENSVTVFEAFMYLHHPQTRALLELVGEGAVGGVRHVAAWFDYFLPREDTGNIHLKPDMGGSSLWDVGVYPNSAAVALGGGRAPEEVCCSWLMEGGVDTSCFAQARFAGGTVAHLAASIRAPFREGVQVVGDRGALLVDRSWKPGLDGRPTAVRLLTPEGSEKVYEFPGVSPYQAEVEAMERCVLDGDEPPVPLSLSREFLKSALALRESARTGGPVRP